MNITLDTQYSTHQNVEGAGSTITYKGTAASDKLWGRGYQLDIADKVMDDKAYQGQGATAEDIMQQAANTDVEAQKNFMLVMSNSVSGEDMQKMKEKGYDPESTDVETYVSIVDKIKVTLAKAGVEITGYNDKLDMDIVEEITGGSASAQEIVKKMQQADLPITQENLEKIAAAAEKAKEIGPLSEDALKYMILNQKAPTIENLYLAQFSSASFTRQAKGYYSDQTGYYAKKADNYNWDNLEKQIDAAVRKAGLAGHTGAAENGKWLVETGIEINTKNLTAITELTELELPMQEEDIIQLVIISMRNGKNPMNTLLAGEVDAAQQAEELAREVQTITAEAIHKVVEAGEAVHLKNLTKAQREIQEQESSITAKQEAESTVADTTEYKSIKEIEAKRQLEEIRLIMTEEANRKLLQSGYHIDTTELGQLVQDLRKLEEAMKAALFQGGDAKVNEERAALYQETLTKTSELASVSMPAAVLGKAAASKEPFSLGYIHQEGTILKKQYQAAGETYEALMTAPRKDMGDSIKKAFRNVDDILKDMELEVNEKNQRAVRILGYNNMEITKENITAVKEADAAVNSVITKMTPAVTLDMIRNQINPLEMSLEDLEAYLTGQEKDIGTDAVKFSKYLQKLQSSNDITEEEREAYIGIYRMFRQIEKTDGAVIGSIVASGAEVNFKNMLHAVRSRADRGIDVRIDKEYGALENLIAKGTPIDSQIMAGYQEQQDAGYNSQEQTQENQDKQTASKIKYYARMAGDIKSELSPEKISGIALQENTTMERFADALSNQAQDPVKEQEYQTEEMKTFRKEMQSVEEIENNIIQALIDFDQPVSIDNIQAASLLINDRGALYKKVFQKAEELSEAAEQVQEQAVSEESAKAAEQTILGKLLRSAGKVTEQLTDEKSAQAAYQELTADAAKVIESMIYEKGASMIDVKAARSLYKGLSLAGNLAKEENYEIPVAIKGEITSVNLKIFHGNARGGKVAVTMDTDTLGKVAAEFDVGSDKVSGFVVCNKSAANSDMEAVNNMMQEVFSQECHKEVDMNVIYSAKLDIHKFGQREETESAQEKIPTRDLYQTAKAFLTALKSI